MKLLRCVLCGQWIGREEELKGYNQCPNCGKSNVLIELTPQHFYDDDELEALWKLFDDIPINNMDEIEEEYLGFPIGTNRFEIWHWFDRTYSKGVASLINNE